MEELRELYVKNHYSYTITKTLDHTIRMLYVFPSMNKLHFFPDVSFIWYEYTKSQMGNSRLAVRHILAAMSRYVSREPVVFEQMLSPFLNRRTDGYPDWCKNAVNGYLLWLRKSFRDESTVRTY
jgi:hypothetical protein